MINMVIAWGFKNWRILAVLAAVLAVLFVGRHIHGKIFDSGVKSCQSEYVAELTKAKDAARASIIKTGGEHDKIIQHQIDKGDTGFGVGSRTSDALDSLRSRSTGR